MTVGQGISKTSALVKQTALGVVGSTGSQYMRRITMIPQMVRDSFENNEIRTDQQSPGIVYGVKKVTAKLSGLLSPATYKLLFAASLRKDFVAGVTTTAIITVTAATTTGAQGTFTRSAGSYLTDGFKIGDVLRWTGWAGGSATNNNAKNMMIIALTATVMTVTTFDGSAIVSDAAGDSVTGTVVGKKTLAPLTGHTNDYFTEEDWYSDLTKSEVYSDLKPAKIDVGLPGTGNATFSCDMIGLQRALGTAQVLTTPTAATTTNVVTAANGLLLANGVAIANVTGITLSIDGNMAAGDPIVGSNVSADIARGRIKVSGQFTALFSDTVLQLLYDAGAALQFIVVLMDNTANLTSDFISFNMGSIKLTGDAADDGEKLIVRTFPFTAGINTAGGAALANDQTILSIQDSAA